jgi:hypothetical protein
MVGQKIKGIDPGIVSSEQRFHLVVDAPQSSSAHPPRATTG